MAASPEFYRAAAAPAFSPCGSPLRAAEQLEEYSCRTPTGSAIAYLREPTTCPPAPRKKAQAPCKKRLFQPAGDQPQVLSFRLDELERIFRPHSPPPPAQGDKRRRSARQQRKQESTRVEVEASS
ncbi:hypothetical protein ACP4OV_022612 [Aristida adscensionis]